MSDFRQSTFCYPGTHVLVNKFDIRDQQDLMALERRISGARHMQLLENPIVGTFDLDHLQAIHRHLFQDLYSWAGEIRTEDIAKGGSIFCYSNNIKLYSDRLFSWLQKENFLKGLELEQFSEKLGLFASEINAIHPFREGNGRSTREFIRSLAQDAGYVLDYSKMDHQALVEAFVKSFSGDHSELAKVFRLNIGDVIINKYVSEFPPIIEASDHLLDVLNKIRLSSPEQEFLSLKKLNGLYKELGKQVESGLLDRGDPTFGMVSDAILDLRHLQAYTPKVEAQVDSTVMKKLVLKMFGDLEL